MTEFAIVFPALFLLFLVIIQTALLMTAKQVVQYAAFSAARSAIVHQGDEKKAKRAADIACVPISPKMNMESLRQLKNYVVELGSIAVDPGLGGLAIPWSEIPGMEIIDKLRGASLNEILSLKNAKLVLGLELIDSMSGGHQEVPLRFPAAWLLTNQELTVSEGDATVAITHNYAMRIPIVNRLFFSAYLHGKLMRDIQERFSYLPDAAVARIRDNAFQAIDRFAGASGTNSLYLIPIKAESTLSMEVDAPDEKYCK